MARRELSTSRWSRPSAAAMLAMSVGAPACHPPYRPALVALGPVQSQPTPDWFPIVRDVVRAEYPRLPIVDSHTQRIGSDWYPFARNDVPGQRRATVYREGEYLAVVVEARFLQVPLTGEPVWGSIYADRVLEDRLARQIEDALTDSAKR